jgi:hypothetical protein
LACSCWHYTNNIQSHRTLLGAPLSKINHN